MHLNLICIIDITHELTVSRWLLVALVMLVSCRNEQGDFEIIELRYKGGGSMTIDNKFKLIQT